MDFGGGYSATSDLDLGKKLEVWISGGGDLVFCNFGFGLREKVWKFGFRGGGYSATSDLDLGKKLEVWIGGVFCKCDGKRKKPK